MRQYNLRSKKMSSSDKQDSIESDQESVDGIILKSTHQDVGMDVHNKIVHQGMCDIVQQKIGKSDNSEIVSILAALRTDMKSIKYDIRNAH